MLKWFEQVEQGKPNVVFSRVRLARNLENYAFPSKLSDEDSIEMINNLELGLRDIKELDNRQYNYALLDEMKELDRNALKERRVFNSTIANKKTPTGILISEEEDTSLILNGADHIRIQLLSSGLHLEELWKRADQIDDFINSKFCYAYDEKYGYLTSYPTNVGTGLRASVIVHLPTLSLSRKFNNLLGDMSRFGAVVKGLYGEGAENYGALYEISNQKTLGRTEKEIIDLVNNVAAQLNNQECQVRTLSLKDHRLEREDEAYKSYGVLKYARRLAIKDAMTFLSQLMAGFSDQILKTEEPCSVYRLMLGIQPANLQNNSDHPMGKEELDVARASYLRSDLPELI